MAKNKYTNSFDLGINLVVNNSELEQIESWWNKPHELSINVVGDFQDILRDIRAGYRTTLSFDIDKTEINSILGAKDLSGDLKEINDQIDRIEDRMSTKARSQHKDDWYDPTLNKTRMSNENLIEWYKLYDERNTLLEKFNALSGENLGLTNLDSFRNFLINDKGISESELVRKAKDTAEKVNEAATEQLNSAPPTPEITNFIVTPEAIKGVRDQIEEGLRIEPITVTPKFTMGENQEEITQNINLSGLSDSINSLVMSLNDRLSQGVDNSGTNVGEQLVQKIQDALDNAQFKISQIELVPNTESWAQQSLDAEINNANKYARSIISRSSANIRKLDEAKNQSDEVKALRDEYQKLADVIKDAQEESLTFREQSGLERLNTEIAQAESRMTELHTRFLELTTVTETLDDVKGKAYALQKSAKTSIGWLANNAGFDDKKLKREYEAVISDLNNALNNIDTSDPTSSMNALREAIEKADVKVKELNVDLQQTKNDASIQKAMERAQRNTQTLNANVANTLKSFQEYMGRNTKAFKMSGYGATANGIIEALGADDITNEKLGDIKVKIARLKAEITATGNTGKTTGEKIKAMYAKFGGWTLVTRSLMKAKQEILQMFEAVKQLDTAMVNLRKVSEGTSEEYAKFFERAKSSAQDLGTSITDIIDATAEFSRLGYNLEESATLGEYATIYSKVAENLSASDAAQSIVSTMKAFNIEASESLRIVDLFNYVGNNFAISSAGIGDSLQRSASSLAAANTSLEETIALTTAANEIMQDPLKVGTSLKTISARIRGKFVPPYKESLYAA